MDIPAECIARVAGRYQTILFQRPLEFAPHEPAIQADFRASDDRLLSHDQHQMSLNLIRKCVNSILQALHRKELEK